MIRRAACALAAFVLTSEVAFAAAPPAWVKELAALNTAGGPAPATVLLDQVDVIVTADGRMRTTRRYAVRVHDRAARQAAAVREVYLTGTGKVREIRGWVLRQNGSVRELGEREAIDVALVNNDVFNEVRVRALAAQEEMTGGELFAAEIESEDRLLYAQLEWQMQDDWPIRDLRRSLTVPSGWRIAAQTFNAPALEPERQGQTTTWRLRDVAALPEEEGMPPVTDLATRLAVSMFGGEGAPAPGQFESWAQVSAWLHALADHGPAIAPAVATRAKELTPGLATDYERAAAIGRFVQRIQYISIQTGIGRGGGYQPRPPATVLERSYGDCKDKASLMRAMLSSLGITSYLVSIYSGDRNYVREPWPSPQQFNHAVIAIALSALPADAASRVDHPSLGPLLVFDPTDEHTPFGQLPLHEQGSLALVVAPMAGALLRMPVLPAAAHVIERTLEGQLAANGTLSAGIHEHFMGTHGAAMRAAYLELGTTEFEAATGRRIGEALPRVQVRKVLVESDSALAFTIRTTVDAGAYAQAQAGLLLLPLPFQADGRVNLPSATARRTPLQLEPKVVRESVRLQLPPGFAVDELPPPLSLETPFGRYAITYAVEGAHLVAKRTLELPMQTIPPDRYAAAYAFFSRIRTADAAPAVLARKQH